MKRDILIPGLIAVGIHASILCAPLAKGGNSTALARKPIHVSIIRPRRAVGAPSASGMASEKGTMRRRPAKRKSSLKQPVICKKKEIDKKYLKKASPEPVGAVRVKSVADSTVGNTSERRGKEVVKQLAAERDHGRRSSFRGEQEWAGMPGQNRQRGIITYAIPEYKENPRPLYPKIARRRGYEGRTLLRVEVLENGRSGRIEVAASSGFDVLDKAALKSVNGWTFVPGTENGKEIKQWVMVPVRFLLE